MTAKQAGVFHGYLPTPSFLCNYTVLGRLLSLATPTPSPLMGEFSDGSLTVVAVTAMLYGLRNLLSSAIQPLRYQRLMASTYSRNSRYWLTISVISGGGLNCITGSRRGHW